ncbi:isoprenylcysteine carboxylmethyltransferase family protein [Mycetocola sp. 2940]|uniref:methyltransferase family protein n=1 Tax=Mycetocola sp. 2940 TaxID=3156452 RepID=UPI0033958ECB
MGDGSGRRWLSNVPIPEQHVVPLVVAAVAEQVVRLRLPRLRVVGALLLIVGAVLAGWAWREARHVLLADPDRLVTTGPYARWRHPMYRAWALGHLGLALFARSGWALAGWLPAVLAVRREVEAEEAALRRRFAAYDRYAEEVPR